MNSPKPIHIGGKRMYRANEVHKMFGFGKTWLYDHVRKGHIPKPISLSNNASVYPEEVVAEIHRRIMAGTLSEGAPYPEFPFD